jgi:hypothetical protein
VAQASLEGFEEDITFSEDRTEPVLPDVREQTFNVLVHGNAGRNNTEIQNSPISLFKSAGWIKTLSDSCCHPGFY